jgi:dihydroflavonol-4-reductase
MTADEMTDAERPETVLVTGGSGFLGGWCVVELLRRGYRVRTTLRSAAREAEVRAAVGAQVQTGDRLSVHLADLGADVGWREAVAGCDYVLHVASPFPSVQPKDADELIVPARDGALRVLRASLAAGVKRVVLTSSVAAVRNAGERAPDRPLTEDDWTDGADTRLTPYTRSKTIAELAAWDLVREAGETDRLTTVNPSAIIGPLLGPDRSYSLQSVERLLGGMPGVPRLGFSFVDVRDVAALEVTAMGAPAAAGERFIAAGPFLWMAQVAAILRDRLGPEARKVPRRVVPDLLVRAMAVFDPEVRSVLGDLGQEVAYSSQKAYDRLGWRPRPIEDSIVDCARSLLAQRESAQAA